MAATSDLIGQMITFLPKLWSTLDVNGKFGCEFEKKTEGLRSVQIQGVCVSKYPFMLAGVRRSTVWSFKGREATWDSYHEISIPTCDITSFLCRNHWTAPHSLTAFPGNEVRVCLFFSLFNPLRSNLESWTWEMSKRLTSENIWTTFIACWVALYGCFVLFVFCV